MVCRFPLTIASRRAKKANRSKVGFLRWMVELGDLNPRPQAFIAQFYMFSDLI